MTHLGCALRATRIILTLPLLFVLAPAAQALELAWPEGATRVVGDTRAAAGYPIATGGFDGGTVPTLLADGGLSEEVWQVPGEAGAPVTLLAWLQEQLVAQGFTVDFQCTETQCGGFDFRYGLPIAEGPDMYVDLGDFHYLSASKSVDEGRDRVILTVSHGGLQGYVHLVRIVPGDLPAEVTPSSRTVTAAPIALGPGAAAALIPHLLEFGSSPLDDLSFQTGASGLSEARYDSLITLAAFLAEDTARRIVLVGHTDAEGSLDANIALSQDRAVAVRRFLIDELGADAAQVEARGIGFLAPRAANTNAEGREANRRVEVVLIAN